MREISRGIYPTLSWKSDLQQCLEIWRRPFPRFFKSVKADLEISYDEEIQGEDILTTRASPREVEADEANGKSQKCIVTIDLDTSVGQLLDMSYPPPHEAA